MRKPSDLRFEPLEDRVLLAVGPQLVSINPNEGSVLDLNGSSTLDVAPRDLSFGFEPGQVLDESTIADSIRIVRSGFNGSDFSDPIDVTPGYIGLGEFSNRVIVRFQETLPDDTYRIVIDGTGFDALRNEFGEPFNDGEDREIDFELDLGAQIIAVVPQPVSGTAANGNLTQAGNQIVVYFNNDDLNQDSASDPAFYKLTHTNDSATNTDDSVSHTPTSVSYNPNTDSAVLTFANRIDLLSGAGTYRLRIGTDEIRPDVPELEVTLTDPGSSYETAASLANDFGFDFSDDDDVAAKSIIISSAIDQNLNPLDYPGADDEPGHRHNGVQSHLLGVPPGVDPSFYEQGDIELGITTIPYNFQDIYGTDPFGNILHNVITPTQKLRAREIFEIYSSYLGVQFVETATDGFTIVTGDLRALSPGIATGPLGVLGLAGDGIAIMDNAELWNDERGESDQASRISWFDTAMHEIGHLLGMGHTDELAPFTVQNSELELEFIAGVESEPVFPGDQDIVHGQHLHRPESNDIDLYSFQLSSAGLFTAETIAERQDDASFLDSALTLFKQNPDGSRTVVARNDDYYSEDSYLELQLSAGQYFVGVTSTGNLDYDPSIANTGQGGTSDGKYDLRLGFRPNADSSIVDTTGVAFDGDADGVAGGVYDFWFRAAAPTGEQGVDEPRTIFVDKTAPAGGDGSLANPYNRISSISGPNALSAAEPGDIVRVLGNGGTDGNVDTVENNFAYEFGFDALGQPLEDGVSLVVPQGVTVMVDAGAIFKMRQTTIDVGSSATEVDRSRSAFQALGTPDVPVYFTSFNDATTGIDTNPDTAAPERGDWGGIIFQNDLDRGEGRFDYEAESIFLNYVNHADIRYGGGRINRASVEQVIAPIHLINARPTVSFNTIMLSADAAISANPDSFEETNYHAPKHQDTVFTSDITRIGPDIHGNHVVENTSNGLFVRIATPAGNQLEALTVSARFDDTDIVHLITNTLRIQGTAGGLLQDPLTGEIHSREDARLAIDPLTVVKLDGARIETGVGAQFIAEGREGQRVIFTSSLDDRFGAGGTFDTNSNDGAPAPGNWGGIYVGHVASASVEQALFAYGGGLTTIEGSFGGTNVFEIHQGKARIVDSIFELNEDGLGGQSRSNRGGLGPNAEGTLFIRGAQPVILGNIIRNNEGPAISANVNSLNHILTTDLGRTTGLANATQLYRDNQGPLIRGNQLLDNTLNGIDVRGGVMTTQGVWDDTDIVHIVRETILVPDFHTYGGLRLESSSGESLVIKAAGETAGFSTIGRPLDINDRLGGAVQVVGQPGFPVVMTSLTDATVGAGFEPDGTPQTRTKVDEFPLPTQPSDSFEIDLNLSAITLANESAANSIQRAARFWEGVFEDPIRVTFDVGFVGGLPSAGLTFPEVTTVDYDAGRTLMVADARDHESIVQLLPSSAELVTTFANDQLDVDGDLRFTRANALALGMDPDDLPQTPSQLDPDEVIDATIFIDAASNVPGVDLFSVMLHEIGRALGFDSTIDDVDAPNIIGTGPISAMDLFRLAPGTGINDFTNAPRILDPALDQVFYDGGIFDPTGIPISNIAQGDIPLSTGANLGDGGSGSFLKDAGLINGVDLGIMQPDGGTFSDNDKRILDLIGWDAISGGVTGSWDGINIGPYSGDRNVDVITEREAADSVAPGRNAFPDTAQYIGALAPHEFAGDDNLRLGIEVHGFINSPADVDVYSFTADAGTEVWIDIDRTSQSLDSVVELIDATGRVLARSNDGLAEQLGDEDLFVDETVFQNDDLRKDVNSLAKSDFNGKDHYSVNAKDAGMRVVLPGPAGSTNTYHVRVRSASDDLGAVLGGESSGVYQLQLRLRELDEIPGSVIRHSDIAYATTGINVEGLPMHSPLLGEAAEDVTDNDTPGNAQHVGNPFASDRGAVSIAGTIEDTLDVDWYQFSVEWESTQQGGNFGSVVFDVDYADGIAKPNLTLSIYDEDLNLVAVANDSDIIDDQPAALEGADSDDHTRGSFGTLDPYIGPITLPIGEYFVAVTSNGLRPEELIDQRLDDGSNPQNRLIRVEPVDSVLRIADERVDADGGSTAEPPVVNLINAGVPGVDPSADSLVPWSLGDMTLYVTTAGPGNTTDTYTVNPFTGTIINQLGRGTDVTGDIAMRSDNELVGISLTPPGANATNGNTGNFNIYSTANGTSSGQGDDNIVTYVPGDNNAVTSASVGAPQAVQFAAMEFTGRGNGEQLWAVGNRTDHQIAGIAGGFGLEPGSFSQNILYNYNGNSFAPIPAQLRPADQMTAAWTNVREVGHIVTYRDNSPEANILTLVGATVVDELTGETTIVIEDKDQIAVSTSSGTPVIFEFDTGPEVFVQVDPFSNFIRDGEAFVLTEDDANGGVGLTRFFEFNTGPVLNVDETADEFTDGQTFTLTDGEGVSHTFEFNNNGIKNSPSNIGINFTVTNPPQSAQFMANQIVTAVNSASFGVTSAINTVDAVTGEARVSFIGDVTSGDDGLTMSGLFTGITVEGDYVVNLGATPVPVEETSLTADVLLSLQEVFDVDQEFDISIAGSRVNWVEADASDFSFISDTVFQLDDLNSAAPLGNQLGDPGVAANHVRIPLNSTDTDKDVAFKLAEAINSNPTLEGLDLTTADLNDALVVLNTANVNFDAIFNFDNSSDPPFTIVDPNDPDDLAFAPGGDITGLAEIDGILYGVSNTNAVTPVVNGPDGLEGGDPLPGGGLFIIDQGSATSDYIQTATDLIGMDFTGLVAGPENLENGRYLGMLFGLTSDGTLHAFDTEGRLQPVFMNGASSVFLGDDLVGATGLAFSTLDRNLWHVNEDSRHNNDEGHRLEVPVTDTRLESAGGASLYFGNETQAYPNGDLDTRFDYNYPGGAHGSIVTETMDLSTYSTGDSPTLYFDYLLETEGQDYVPGNIQELMRDAFRVYVQDNSDVAPETAEGNNTQGEWHLLATNDSFRDFNQADEFDLVARTPNNSPDSQSFPGTSTPGNFGVIQELFDNPNPNDNQWRQAVIDLSAYAGSNDIRLRFDFSTAASMDMGSFDPDTLRVMAGVEMRAVEGSRTADGEVLDVSFSTTLIDPQHAVFEIDHGYSLSIPSASAITEGETLFVDDGVVAPVTFEFDFEGDGVTLGNIAIELMPEDSAEVVASKVQEAMALAGVFDWDTVVAPTGLELQDGDLLTIDNGDHPPLTFEFDLDGFLSSPSNVGISFDPYDNWDQIAEKIQSAIAGSVLSDTMMIRNAHRLSLQGVTNVTFTPLFGPPPTLTIESEGVHQRGNLLGLDFGANVVTEPGSAIQIASEAGVVLIDDPTETTIAGTPLLIPPHVEDWEVARIIAQSLADTFAEGVTGAFPIYRDTVNIAGHEIIEQGPFGLSDILPGDEFGSYTAGFSNPGAFSSQANLFEGVHLDNIIVGLAERGEIVTSPDESRVANPQFTVDYSVPDSEILIGDYQLEIRPGAEYVSRQTGILTTFDSNDRLSEEISLFAPAGWEISGGQTFVLSDGIDTVTFEYLDINSIEPVAADHVAIPYDPSMTSNQMSQLLVQAINSVEVQITRRLDITAGTSATSERIDLFGEVILVELINPRGDIYELNNGPGDGTLNVGVDAYGAYGSAVGINQADAVYDPLGGSEYFADSDSGGEPGPTTFQSGIAIGFGDERQFLTSGAIGATGFLPVETMVGDSSTVRSTFEYQGLSFDLIQVLAPTYNELGETVGSVLTQQYKITNITSSAVDFDLVRYYDGDLGFDGSEIIDGGGRIVQDGVEILFETDNALATSDAQSFVGISAEGGTIPLTNRFEIDEYAQLLTEINEGQLPTDTIFRDGADEDQFVDEGLAYDLTLALRNLFSLEPGEQDTYTTQTIFGTGIPSEFEEPDAASPTATGAIEGIRFENFGDNSRVRDQGQLILESNRIINSSGFGIVVDATVRDGVDGDTPHQGPSRNLQELNSANLAPGVTVKNNILTHNYGGGILFSGDENVGSDQIAAVPFGRIVNNTIVGVGGSLLAPVNEETGEITLSGDTDVAISVRNNASPTLLNNIVANSLTGVEVDASSNTTILGGMLYQGNISDSNFGLGDFPIRLDNEDPLFVDAMNHNYYLSENSEAIDSSVDSLQDRLELVTVKDPLGIALSPILAPGRDNFGQLRVDDPSVEPPVGLGENVFKDRGAIDRVDFAGPSAGLTNPLDNDALGNDQDLSVGDVSLIGGVVNQFSIQLVDGADGEIAANGTGIDDASVTNESVVLTLDGAVMEEGVDYQFTYSSSSDVIRLTPLAGLWAPGEYVITVDNSVETGIQDVAGNPLKANRTTLDTIFSVEIGDQQLDFGDAQDPSYPTLFLNNGARHVVSSLVLGSGVSQELDGQPTSSANGDFDDGVSFDSTLLVGTDETFVVQASESGLLDAWIDFNDDGDWDDAGEQIFSSQPVTSGLNELAVSIPVTATRAPTAARFRLSTSGGLSPTGLAADGEVEDYLVSIGGNPWQNSTNVVDYNNDGFLTSEDIELARYDVNGDGAITPNDALTVINELDQSRFTDSVTGELPTLPSGSNVPPADMIEFGSFVDVDGSPGLGGQFYITPLDALLVIIALDELDSPGAASATGSGASGSAMALAISDESGDSSMGIEKSLSGHAGFAGFSQNSAGRSDGSSFGGSVFIDPQMAIEDSSASFSPVDLVLSEETNEPQFARIDRSHRGSNRSQDELRLTWSENEQWSDSSRWDGGVDSSDEMDVELLDDLFRADDWA